MKNSFAVILAVALVALFQGPAMASGDKAPTADFKAWLDGITKRAAGGHTQEEYECAYKAFSQAPDLQNFFEQNGFVQGFPLLNEAQKNSLNNIFPGIAKCVPSLWASYQQYTDAMAIANLRNLYNACMQFWANEGPSQKCTLDTLNDPIESFRQSKDVEIEIKKFQEGEFEAVAKHKQGERFWKVDAQGTVSKMN